MAAKKTAEKKPEAEKKDAPKEAPKKAAPAAKAAPPPAPEVPKTKFSEFLAAKKLDPRRVLSSSRTLERLLPEDRAIRLAKRRARKGAGEGEVAKETRKARSGRPVTRRAIAAALIGKSVSGPTKTRILRAVNQLLEQKKVEKVDLRALF
jgi:hypothetical protein